MMELGPKAWIDRVISRGLRRIEPSIIINTKGIFVLTHHRVVSLVSLVTDHSLSTR